MSETRLAFCDSLLAGMKADRGRARTLAMLGWFAAESGTEVCDGHSGARYNPLNTTLSRPGAVDFNSAGVKSYPSLAVGLEATLATLLQSNMAGIVHAFRTAHDSATIGAAIASSPWGTGGAIRGGIEVVTAHPAAYSMIRVGDVVDVPPHHELRWGIFDHGERVHSTPSLAIALAIAAARLKAAPHRAGEGVGIRLVEVTVP